MDEGLLDDYLDGLFDDDLCDIENMTITVSREVADFYKQFFDELIPFNGNPKGWEPYHA